MIKAKLLLTAGCFGTVLCAGAQVKPNTQTQPSSTTQTLNPVPAAYATGTPVSYIRTWDAAKPYSADTSLSSGYRNVQEVKQASQYVDGIGRSIETVAKDVTPNGYDMVSAQVYDPYSREIYKYLPYVDTSADGNFKNDPFNKQANFEKAFYNPTNNSSGEKFFYGKTDVEASPLNRPVKTYAPGNSWAGRGVGVSMQYLVNDVSDSVCIWNIGYPGGSLPSFNGYYPSGQLSKTVTTDERSNQVVEFKDKEGHVILKKVQNSSTFYSGHTGWLCTYYIYDDFGYLRMVIQPLGVTKLIAASWSFDGSTWQTSVIAQELCFSYEYDERGRLIKKRIPGSGEISLVYDTRDHQVMMQDPNLRGPAYWLYTVYDSLGRVTATGKWHNTGDRSYHQNLANNGGNYPNPNSEWTIVTRTYYDDYSWVSGSGSGLPTSAYTGYNSNTNDFYTASDVTFPYPRSLTTTNLTRGMVTGTMVNVINTSINLYSLSFYDDRMRILQTQSTNYTGDIDTVINQYSFIGQVLRTLVCHGKGGTNAQAYQVLTKMTYDAGGRVTQMTQKTGTSAEVIIASNTYDELGELAQKNIGQQRNSLTDYSYSSQPLDGLAYTYNIRGWLRGINKDYANAVNNTNWFGMELNYDYGFTSTQLNGNIAGIKWRNANDGAMRAYGFTYDKENRLNKADFTQNAGGSTWDLSAGIDFSVHAISYDGNGNIAAMNQMGLKLNTATLVDSLVYGYNTNSNRLKYVTDKVNDTSAHLGDFTEINNNTSQDYWQDGNGNLIQDKNKGITNIHYNFLNLPDTVSINGKGTIVYLYTATGVKLQKIVNDSTVTTPKITRTDYAGMFIYQNDTLQYVATPEGRARPKNINKADTMFYDYFEKDHLGNTRVVLTDEKQQDVYPAATVENNTNAFATEKTFYNINTADTIGVSRIASWSSTTGKNYPNNNGNPPYNNNPYSNTTATSAIVYKLNGNTGDKTGLGITLKVMTGDAVDIYAKSFWHSTGTNPVNTYTITSALTNFINAFAGTNAVASAGKGATASALNGSSITTSGLTSWLGSVPNPSQSNVPKAYINWILFDEQFKPVSSGSGFDLVSTTGDNVKSHHSTVNISQGGYLYVYCSNESNYDVYFDNLQVIQTRGPLLETDNYYPFGLMQSGVSSKAAGKLENKVLYNGKELQHKEFSDGNGLEWEDYGARMYDEQIGRFFVQDVLAEKYFSLNPYQYCANSPVNFIDENGDFITIEKRDEHGNLLLSLMYQDGKAYYYKMGADNQPVKLGEWDGSDEFIKQTVIDLISISNTPAGKTIVEDLVGYEGRFDIEEAKYLNQTTTVGTNNGALTHYYQKGGSNVDATINKSQVVLGHELFHAWAGEFTKVQLGSSVSDHLSREKGAVAFENYLRAYFGEKVMRTHYAIDPDDKNQDYEVASGDVNVAKNYKLPPKNRRAIIYEKAPADHTTSGDHPVLYKPFVPRYIKTGIKW
ncbi:MAG TPA: DUF6443 domain-containing protein [Chitinophagaceae bacterium]|nr:DUF6443 domain-containing protein [Chitinophagaceae bacterium]